MGITRQQALDCFASDDLIGIGMEADAVRRRLHPEGVVSYNIDRTLSCPENDTAFDSLYEDIRETEEMGGTAILLQGSSAPIHQLEALFTGIKQRFPQIWLHGLSAGEILDIAAANQLDLRTALLRLRDAGLDSIPGHDAAILDDAIRTRHTSRLCTAENWITVHRTAHELGIPTTASMLFGIGETAEQRVRHLEQVHRLQEETHGFIAFLPVSVRLQSAEVDEPTAVEYLKTLAISRMVLDNIPNLQTSWATQGPKVLQMGLRFGSNDAGSVMLEKSSSPVKTTEEQLRQIIRDAGFKPVQRDTMYRTLFLN